MVDLRQEETMDGIKLVAVERERQVSEEGWTAEHDDTHVDGEMANAAACLAATRPIFVHAHTLTTPHAPESIAFTTPWPMSLVAAPSGSHQMPWHGRPDSTDDRIRNLVKAGALIAAEIDRLQRAT